MSVCRVIQGAFSCGVECGAIDRVLGFVSGYFRDFVSQKCFHDRAAPSNSGVEETRADQRADDEEEKEEDDNRRSSW